MQQTTSLLAALALVTTVACDSKPEPAKTEPAKTAPAEVQPPPPTSEPAKTEPAPATTEPAEPAKIVPPTAGAPGPAYFAIDKKGVVVLDDKGFRLIEGSPPTLQKDLQIGPDGALWLVGFEDIYRLEGERFVAKAKASFDNVGSSADEFAVAPNGDLWVASYKGVSRWDGKGWSTTEKAAIGAGDDLLGGIVVDRDNRVWVSSTHKVHIREGEAWRDVDMKKVKKGTLYLKDLELGPDGAVYLLIDEALFKFDAAGATATKVPVGVKGFAQMSDINFSLNGSVGIISYEDVYHVPANGSPRKYSSEKARDFKADGITAVAPDDAGRLWVGSDIGVVVIAPGAPRIEWLSGSVPELVGKIDGIVVFGSGPATLPTGGPQAKGGLTGKIVRDGAPVVGVTVELCPGPSTFFTRTPCHDSAIKFTTKTDDTGTWTVQDVPLGTYGLAVKNGKKWSITLMRDMGDGMKTGEVYDTGSITLEKK